MQEALRVVRIQRIFSNYIGILRPRKGTYYFLEWFNEPSGWRKYTGGGFPDLRIHKSTVHTETDIVFPIRGRTRRTSRRGYGTGEFLISRHTIIPIIVCRYIQPNMIGDEFTARRAVEYYAAQELWTEENLPLEVPGAAAPEQPQPQPQPQPQQQVPQPLPMHIARIIADDYSKNGSCPITMSKIVKSSVTSCFHVFESDALHQWTATHNNCPVCRNSCSVTAVI